MHGYDVALSFAGEQRSYVEEVATVLRRSGVRIFYDKFEQDRLWGRDLTAELDRVYRKESRYVVVFVSADYRDKQWTRHEFRSTLAKAIEQRDEFVLPVRFDDTDLDGLPPTIGYLDANTVSPKHLAEMLLEKLSLVPVTPPHVLEVWRLVAARYAPTAFTGEGASLFGGRWNHRDTKAVYGASSLCLAILETALHAVPSIPSGHVAVGAKLHLSAPPTILSQSDLPKDWAAFPPPKSMQDLGTQWLRSNVSAALIVPSVALPAEQILLLNPMHKDFQTLTIFSEESVNIAGLKYAG